MSALAELDYADDSPDEGEIQRVSWDEFLSYFANPSRGWQQGEHVTAIGPTGAGKTTLLRQILPIRRYVLVLASKPRDPLMSSLKEDGYRVGHRWPSPAGVNRYVYWPNARRMRDLPEQKEAFRRVLEDVYEVGGWTVYMDEIRYLSDFLGLKSELQVLWLQARSMSASLVGGTQRPFYIPLEAYDQATHLFFWRDSDRRNLNRISELNDVDANRIKEVVRNLPKHEVLYVNTRTGEVFITKAEKVG